MKVRFPLLAAIAIQAAFVASAQPSDGTTVPPPACISLQGLPAEPNPVGKDGIIRKFKAPVLRLMRTTAEKPKGTALILPSGGYHVLSVVADGVKKGQFWNSIGYDVAILEYTISEKNWERDDKIRDAALKDVLAAVPLVRGRAKEFGLHEGKFILMGGSAGGHLAARTVAALPEKDRPDALVLFYPAYLEEIPAGAKDPGMPVPGGKLPSLFAAIATNDNAKWINGARAYAGAWEKAGGQAQFKLFDDGGHGFAAGSRAEKEWPALLKTFEETNVGGRK